MESTIHVLLTRPEAQSQMTAALLRALGYVVHIHPLMDIEMMPDAITALQEEAQHIDIQAWIATSKHAIDALDATHILPLQSIPLYVPSEVSAEYARSLGWSDVRAGQGDALTMMERLCAECLPSSSQSIVYVRGHDVRHDISTLLQHKGYTVREHVVYRASAKEALSSEMQALWTEDVLHVVMLFSSRSAVLLEQGLQEAGLIAHAARVHVVAMSAHVAHALDRECWAGIHAAAAPTQDAMLTHLLALSSDLTF